MIWELFLGKWRPIFNKIQKTPQGGPRGPKGIPQVAQDGQRDPKGWPKRAQGHPKGSQREPKVAPKEAKGTPKTPKGSQRDKVYISKLPINRKAAVMLILIYEDHI